MSIIIVGNYSVMVSPNAKIEDKGSSSGRARAVKEPPYFSKESGGLHWKPKNMDVSLPINRLNSTVLDNMILQMRKEGLSDSSINSYTRTLKCFLSWCNEEGYTKANLKIYKAAETVKEVYTDEELLTLMANCLRWMRGIDTTARHEHPDHGTRLASFRF